MIVDGELGKRIVGENYKLFKSGKYVALMGFDKKMYICRKYLFDRDSPKVMGALDGETKVEELSKKVGLPLPEVRIILRFLQEKGEVYEKKAGVFDKV